MKKQLGYTLTELCVLIFLASIALAGIGGWIANIIKLIESNFDPLTGLVVARIIGVFFAPLGAVLGFI